MPSFRQWLDALRAALNPTAQPPKPQQPGRQVPPVVSSPPVKYKIVERWRTNKETKGSGLFIRNTGTVLDAVYDNKSRKDTWLREDGVQFKHINGETANFFDTADGRTWVTVEKGTDGEQHELIGRTLRGLGWQAHYCGCGCEYGGAPHWLDCAKGGTPTLRDIRGRVILNLPGQGIPYYCLVRGGAVYASICDGQQNGIAIVTATEREFVKCDARGLTVRGGRVIAGVAGTLQVVANGALTPAFANGRLGNSIDSMATDGDGATWISTSAPDCLWRWDASGDMVKIAEFADDSDGGALFRSRVSARAGRVVWGRNDKRGGNRWVVFDVVRA